MSSSPFKHAMTLHSVIANIIMTNYSKSFDVSFTDILICLRMLEVFALIYWLRARWYTNYPLVYVNYSWSKTSNQLKHEHYCFLSNSIKSTSPYIMYVIETIDTFSTETQIYQ